MAIDKVDGIKFSEIKTQLKTPNDNDLSDYHSDIVLDTELGRLVRFPGKNEPISFGMFNNKTHHNDKPVNAPGVTIESQPSNLDYFKGTGTVSASTCVVLITEADNALPFPIIPGQTIFSIKEPGSSTYRELNSNEFRKTPEQEQLGRFRLSAKYSSNSNIAGEYQYRIVTQMLGPADETDVNEDPSDYVVKATRVIFSNKFTITKKTANAPTLSGRISRFLDEKADSNSRSEHFDLDIIEYENDHKPKITRTNAYYWSISFIDQTGYDVPRGYTPIDYGFPTIKTVTGYKSKDGGAFTSFSASASVRPDFGPSPIWLNVEAGGFTEQYTEAADAGEYRYYVVVVLKKDYTDPDGNAYEATQTLTGLIKTATVTYSFINEGGNYGVISSAKFVAMGGETEISGTSEQPLDRNGTWPKKETTDIDFVTQFTNAKGLNFYIEPGDGIFIPPRIRPGHRDGNKTIFKVPNDGKHRVMLRVERHNETGNYGSVTVNVGMVFDDEEGKRVDGVKTFWNGYHDANGDPVSRGTYGVAKTPSINVSDSNDEEYDHYQIDKRNVNEGDPFEIKVTGTNLPANKQTATWNTTLPAASVDATSGTISLGYVGGQKGQYIGNLSLGTTTRTTHYEDVTGKIFLEFSDGTNIGTIPAKIKNIHTAPVTDPSGAQNITESHGQNRTVGWSKTAQNFASIEVSLANDGTYAVSRVPNRAGIGSGAKSYISSSGQVPTGDWTVRFKPLTAIETMFVVTEEDIAVTPYPGIHGTAYKVDYGPRGDFLKNMIVRDNKFKINLEADMVVNKGVFYQCQCDYEFYNTKTKAVVAGATTTLQLDMMYMLGDEYNTSTVSTPGGGVTGIGDTVDPADTVVTNITNIAGGNFAGIVVDANGIPIGVDQDAIDAAVAAATAGITTEGLTISVNTTAGTATVSAIQSSATAQDEAEILAAGLTAGDLAEAETLGSAHNTGSNFSNTRNFDTSSQVTHPGRGTLLRTYCGTGGGSFNAKFSKYGVYANGNGGEYIKLLESNSSTCGYTAPAFVPTSASISAEDVFTAQDLAELEAAGMVPGDIPFTPSTAIVNSTPNTTTTVAGGMSLTVPNSVYVNPTTVNQNVGTIENNSFNNIQFPTVDTGSMVIPNVSIDTAAITENLKNINVGNIFQGLGSLGIG